MSAKNQNVKRSKKSSDSSRSKQRAKAQQNSVQNDFIISPRVKAILFAAVAILFTVLIFLKGQNLWTAIRGFFFGVFGFCIFLVPVLLGYLSLIAEKGGQVAHLKAKIFLSVLIVLFAGATVYVACGAEFQNQNFFVCLGKLFLQSSDTTKYMTFGCGLIGGILGYPLVAMGGETVAFVICVLALMTFIFIVTNISVKDMAGKASETATYIRRKSELNGQRRRAKREAERNELSPNMEYNEYRSKNEMNKRDSIDVPLDDEKSSKRRRKKAVISNGIDVDVVDLNEGNAVEKDLSQDLINIINRASKPLGADADTTVEDIAGDISSEKASKQIENSAKQSDSEDGSVESTTSRRKKGRKASADEIDISDFDGIGYKVDDCENQEDKKNGKSYHYPPIQLLNPVSGKNDRNAMDEMHNNAKKLIETLASFGVKASIVDVSRGPSVTRYELQPAPGVKISKITGLSDDIALNLAANGVRIEAPIPGKAAVGIEVPNKVVSMVSMRELIDSNEFKSAESKLTTVLGKDISGEIVVADLAKMPHLLIAGTTGSGKSVCVNSILMSILFKASPDEVKLLLVDPKMVEFSKYKGIPHLLVPVVSDAKKAAGALAWAVNEMLQRYKIFSEYDCKDIDSYNSLIESNFDYMAKNPPVENDEGELIQPVLEVNGLPVAKEKMSRVVIAIDELADLMMAAPSEVEESICRLAQMARAAGMHLILATQRPTVNVITGLIKANVPSRIALKVSSNTDSRTILDAGGGEKLIGRGDMLFSPVGAPKPIRVQGCFASDKEIEGVTAYIKKSYSAQYNEEIEETIKRIAAEEIAAGKKSADGGADADDGLDFDSRLDDAIKCVIEAGQASTSLVQRRLKVGYARAGRMIDEMERIGVVGPHQGSKPRDVLMTYNEWLERRNVLQNKSE